MKFGLRILPMTGDLRELIHLSQLAERAGFDQVWFPADPFMQDVRALAVAVAEHTSTIQVGVMISPFGTDPAELAPYAATVDLLSGGRTLICIGCHSTEMCGWTGQDPSDMIERTRAVVSLFRALLQGEVARTDGPIFHWTDECYLRFSPIRSQIPVYIAAADDDLLRLGGEIGDGVLPPLFPPESAKDIISVIRQGAQSAGRDLAHIDFAGCVWVSVSTDSRKAGDALRSIVSYFGRFLSDSALRHIGLSYNDFDGIRRLYEEKRAAEAAESVTDQMLQLAIVGSPADLIMRIEELAGLGLTQINVGGPLGPDPAEAIELLGKKVIPHFR